MPRVSIIVTTYRHESFIERTLQSLLDQTYTDFEILIGDDSPDEKTWHIIESFIEKHPGIIRAWHHTSNKGIVGNMNFLLEQVHSKSSYIAFLEGDDRWSRNYLEKKLNIWKDYPDIGLIYNELSTIDQYDTVIERRFIAPRTRKWYQNVTDTIWNFLVSDMVCFSYSTLMVRREVVKKIRDFDRSDLMGSESDFWMQIGSIYPIYGISEPLTYYRRHTQNTSKNLNKSISHFEFLIREYQKHNFIDALIFKKMEIIVSMMRAFAEVQNRDFLWALRCILQCLSYSCWHSMILGSRALYYRLVRPFVFRVFDL